MEVLILLQELQRMPSERNKGRSKSTIRWVFVLKGVKGGHRTLEYKV